MGASGKRLYETGVEKGVLYPLQSSGDYTKGVAWNGLTGVTESPSGAESSPIYADNIKYLNLISAEEFGATIEAYTYPDEFAICDGSVELSKGVSIGQQARKTFGLCYRTALGNDIDGTDYGYKLHLIYGATAAPSEKEYATINDSPEAITFSWELSTTPVSVDGLKPTASLTIDSTKVDKSKLDALESILYGTDNVEARLPLPNEVASLFKESAPQALSVTTTPADKGTAVAVGSSIVLTFNNPILSESVYLISSAGTIINTNKTWNSENKVLTMKPSAALSAATSYLLNVTGVIDRYNQSLPVKIVTFTTA